MSGQTVFPFAPGHLRRPHLQAKALSPRVSPAALRVPDPRQLLVEVAFPSGHPQIFVHEGARQSLERRLGFGAQRPVFLSVTDNRRHMISFCSEGGVLRARLHHMFLDAPATVQDALVQFVVRRDRCASAVVGRYIHDNGHRIRASRPISRRLTTQGLRHDLLTIFQKVNDAYFGGCVDALITWGTRVRARNAPRRAIKLGSYSASERLIRIHPVLDRKWVPRYFVAYVVYHEMLHHVIPATRGTGRRTLHPPVFLAREQAFRDFERALAWEKAHIARLLRA